MGHSTEARRELYFITELLQCICMRLFMYITKIYMHYSSLIQCLLYLENIVANKCIKLLN